MSKLRSTGKSGAWAVRSAGTWTTNGEPAHPEAIKAGTELRLDLSTHRTHEVNTALMAAADLIIVMEKGHKEALECEFPSCRERIALLGELAGEGNLEIPDPSKLDFEEGNAVAHLIVACIDKNFSELLQRAEISSRTKRKKRPIQ
jgi:protein-tyrosine phosphatase